MKQKYRKPKEAPAAPVYEKPEQVRDAVVILYSVVSIGFIYFLLNMEALVQMAEQGMTAIMIVLCVSIFSYGLLAYLAYRMSRQAPFARYVFFGLFAVRLPLYAVFLPEVLDPCPSICMNTGFEMMLEILAIVFLTRKPARAWFAGEDPDA